MSPTTAGDAARARRIEGATAEVMERAGRAAPGGVESLAVAGGRALWLGPGSPFSAAVGLGLGGEVDPVEVDLVERHLGRSGAPVRVELAAPADGTLASELGVRGYSVRAFRQVWVGRPLPPGGAGDPRVRPARPGEEPLWSGVVAEAWLGAGPGGPWREALRGPSGPEGQEAFLAFVDGVAVGAALATDVDGVALLSAAGVLPGWRGRGVHGALLVARRAWARDRGCDLLAASTCPASPSERALERAGFRCAYPKAILVGPGRGVPG